MKINRKLKDLSRAEYIEHIDNPCFSRVNNNSEDMNCWFYNKTLYSKEWLNQTIEIEIPDPIYEFTRLEKDILDNCTVLNKYKYLLRDYGGALWLYEEQPMKLPSLHAWVPSETNEFIRFPFDNLFQFVQWEDKKPTLIESLLKGKVIWESK